MVKIIEFWFIFIVDDEILIIEYNVSDLSVLWGLNGVRVGRCVCVYELFIKYFF